MFPLRPLESPITPFEARHFLSACACLILAQICVKKLSFPQITKLLCLQSTQLDSHPVQLNSNAPTPLAVKRAAKYLPGTYVCLAQALAGLLLSKSKGQQSYLILGVKTGHNSELQAHAWLSTPKAILLGGSFGNYKQIATFK